MTIELNQNECRAAQTLTSLALEPSTTNGSCTKASDRKWTSDRERKVITVSDNS